MKRSRVLAALALLVALAVAVPALAAPPTDKPAKGPKTPISVTGTVVATEDAEGKVTYTVTAGGKTYQLDAGPKWFFETSPLQEHVGDRVKIDGEIAEGSTEIDVLAVDGTALRAAGKPAWAGGWKKVGERHPGWSQEKQDRMNAKFGDCFPPGQCKEKPARGGPEATSAP